MNIQHRYPGTPDEFLLWNAYREGKREFVRGKVLELMINVTRSHVDIATNLILVVGPQLDRSKFSIGTADFAVRTADGIRYADFFIDRRSPRSGKDDLAASEPVLLAEILSPSSYGRDFVEKAKDYASIGSLLHYIILSQEEPRVWLWSRGDDEAWPGTPVEMAGEGEVVELSALMLRLPLASVYTGIAPRPAQ